MFLKRAEHHACAFAAEIDAEIGIASDGEFVERAWKRFGDNVMMFDGIKRDGDAAFEAEFASPHAAAEDDVFGFDGALFGDDAGGTAVCALNVEDADSFENGCAASAGAFGESHGDFARNHFPVVRKPGCAEDIVSAEKRPFFEGGFGRN